MDSIDLYITKARFTIIFLRHYKTVGNQYWDHVAQKAHIVLQDAWRLALALRHTRIIGVTIYATY